MSLDCSPTSISAPTPGFSSKYSASATACCKQYRFSRKYSSKKKGRKRLPRDENGKIIPQSNSDFFHFLHIK
ncbi:hypothetical protein BpHYR1_020837 [Brachionus plicatilis]|uniref:Uncharacterized protein n=1 Tax=Brachionus plicatilis TaxID=10195 RepID=A0A3M7RNU1_BRAPC|nr:hypothetical protein BpHYR1_020837 [Brachionus plicatilis]